MPSFTDSKGRSWDVVVNVWTLTRVKDHTGVLLTSLMEKNGELFAKLHADPILLADIGWRLVEDQAAERDVDVKDFAESILGDPLGALRKAVLEGAVDFFADPETRKNLRLAMEKHLEIAGLLTTEAAERLAAIDSSETAARLTDYVLSGRQFAESNPGGSHLGN